MTKADRLKSEETYWLMKWLKLLLHSSGCRNVGEGFLKHKSKQHLKKKKKAKEILKEIRINAVIIAVNDQDCQHVSWIIWQMTADS